MSSTILNLFQTITAHHKRQVTTWQFGEKLGSRVGKDSESFVQSYALQQYHKSLSKENWACSGYRPRGPPPTACAHIQVGTDYSSRYKYTNDHTREYPVERRTLHGKVEVDRCRSVADPPVICSAYCLSFDSHGSGCVTDRATGRRTAT